MHTQPKLLEKPWPRKLGPGIAGPMLGNLEDKQHKDFRKAINNESKKLMGSNPLNTLEALINLGYSKEKAFNELYELFKIDMSEERAIYSARSQIENLWNKELFATRTRFITLARKKGFYPKNLAEALFALGFDKIKAFSYLRHLNHKLEYTLEQADKLAREEIKQFKMPTKTEK